jgi:hypothetical protein
MKKVTVEGYIVHAAHAFSVKAGEELLIFNGVCFGVHDLDRVLDKPVIKKPDSAVKVPKQQIITKKPDERSAITKRRMHRRMQVLETIHKHGPIVTQRINSILNITDNAMRQNVFSDITYFQLHNFVESKAGHSEFYKEHSITDAGIRYLQEQGQPDAGSTRRSEKHASTADFNSHAVKNQGTSKG